MADEDPNLVESPLATNRNKPATRKRPAKPASSRNVRKKSRSRSIGREPQRQASGLVRRGRRLAEDAQHWAEGAVPRLARNMHLPSPPSLDAITEANPVILGAVGLGIGVIIGALLPRESFHSGMQGLGLSGSTTPSRARRSSSKSRSRK
jgi:hypothetical protein